MVPWSIQVAYLGFAANITLWNFQCVKSGQTAIMTPVKARLCSDHDRLPFFLIRYRFSQADLITVFDSFQDTLRPALNHLEDWSKPD